jgi:CheY-like chemotaxis protein
VIDGATFAQTYGKTPGAHAPIVVISVSSHTGERAAEMGADAFIPKPFDLDDLMAVLHPYVAVKRPLA